jgi:hypothetical protein
MHGERLSHAATRTTRFERCVGGTPDRLVCRLRRRIEGGGVETPLATFPVTDRGSPCSTSVGLTASPENVRKTSGTHGGLPDPV